MQIDWLTVAAQIVNFLVLVYLLQRFLYAPVMNAMSERERGIAQRIGEAEQREREADDASKAFHGRQAELDSSRDSVLEDARAHAQKEREALLEEARTEIGELRKKWRHELAHEQEDFSIALRQELAQAALDIARRVLVDLADAKLDDALIEAFFTRIESLDESERRTLSSSDAPLEVASAFALDAAARGRMTKRLHALLGAEREVHYRQSPEHIGGIELASAGHKIGWTIAERLREIEGAIRERLGSAAAEA